MKGITVGYALCGSFCTLSKSVEQIKELKGLGCNIIPIMSQTVYSTDTRFGSANSFKEQISAICQSDILHTITQTEPIGPKDLLDILVIAPCTGNTLSKLSCGITDTSVTMAAKAHLRNGKPLLIAAATNDALSASSKNIAALMNRKNIYFVPLHQDDPEGKPTSLIADFTKIAECIPLALSGRQMQPIFI